jgi:FdhD protein
MKTSVQQAKIMKIGRGASEELDLLAVEEPLEIRLGYGPVNQREQRKISVTMRTPGHDFELALGFLFTEGIIHNYKEIESIHYCQDLGKQQNNKNVVRVELSAAVQVDLKRLQRNFYTTSSCGVCGKTSIEAIETVCPHPVRKHFIIREEVIHNAPFTLREAQLVFNHTGGLHAAGLFDKEGQLLLWREDVGRHNALDKLLGACLIEEKLPLQNNFIFLSGRVSFELVQKALMGGAPMIAAVGAPSSLAVNLAQQFDMALLGFVRDQRFNIYSGSHCILLKENLQESNG